ncbi:serine/threonine-protein kinase [Streptomonospora sp. DSM 45055]|uniref:non-specific serine/threonine protein kinase n=1 Tax=Streptomonospora wellingtoniae TaxID=3075544 RepID=A0ABU2KQV9_9ACTN|nr:serine/threonine-protein kinase [Streptomonospora sp. DSM 45055]MDT0301567.1 serine/threonine-protein kinase [Streptomonospora sp. DSM 45055]
MNSAAAAVDTGTPRRVLKGRYELVDEIARGGVGTVWRATDLVLDRRVAVKELRLPDDLSAAERDGLLQRTTREARVAARLAHPGVVTVLDVVDEDDRPWIVMEYIDARTLASIIDVAGPLPYQRVAEIGLQLIDALRVAHDDGIVHRDVKPENVMISEDGRVVLTDFGLAAWTGESALTSSGRIIGSPSYIPPERAKAGPVGPESDLWSLGATLYAAVEGHPPYDRKGYIRILKGADLDDPPTAQNAGPLAPVLAGLLHVQPGDRLTADNATKMLRIAALAPWAPETSPETAAKTAATGAQPVVPRPAREDAREGGGDRGGGAGAPSSFTGGEADEADEEGESPAAEDGGASEDDEAESAREHFRQGAHLLRNSFQESVSDLQDQVSDSVTHLHERIQRHRPESVGHLLTSIRDSTDTLGLTSSGKHREGSSLPVVLAVIAGVLLLLGIVLWALLFRT